jgi:hypothetical protein
MRFHEIFERVTNDTSRRKSAPLVCFQPGNFIDSIYVMYSISINSLLFITLYLGGQFGLLFFHSSVTDLRDDLIDSGNLQI